MENSGGMGLNHSHAGSRELHSDRCGKITRDYTCDLGHIFYL
jgi:hypothetical protein